MLNTKDVMSSDVISISPEASILDACRIMFENHIRHLPVVDQDKKLLGLLSERDVQRAMVVNKDEIFLNSHKKVLDYMTAPVITVSEDAPLADVIEIMINKKISAVVIDQTKGIITSEDMLKHLLAVVKRDEEMMMKPLSFYFPTTLF